MRYLRGELSRLRRLVVGSGPSPGREDAASATSSLRSFQTPGEPARGAGSRGAAEGYVERPFTENASRSRSQGSGPSEASVTSRSVATSCTLSWGEREEICQGIGEWVLNSLRGVHRGPSGRDRIPLANRVWLVFRDFEGLNYEPVHVCTTWTSCHNLVKRGHDTGESIFVGLPSQREAQAVAAAAGVGWPAQI